MASSPIYRATPEISRSRSSYSVPALSRDVSRGGTPGSSRGSKGFHNRSVTPSFSRAQSIARDDVAILEHHRQRVLSKGKVLGVFSELERKYKDTPLEDDDEVDLMTEIVYKSDGSMAPWQPDREDDRPDWANDEAGHENNSIQAGTSRRREVNRNPDDADEDTESDSDSHYDMEMEEEASEEEEDEMGSWQVQEEDIKEQLAHRKAALLLASLKSQPDLNSDEEMEEFLRHEEAARARRMSARVEGRDSRCHTDNLSDSVKSEEEEGEGGKAEEEMFRPEYRSPSKFTTIITDTVEDLFADDESGEDELALRPDMANNDHGSEESASDNDLQARSDLILARARQVRSTWQLGESSDRRPRILLSPDSSPEPAEPASLAETMAQPSSVKVVWRRPKQAPLKGSAAQSDTSSGRLNSGKDVKGKSRMAGERPTDHAILDDIFGPHKSVDPRDLDHRRYRQSRYRQKASMNYKTCRYCREAEPARAELAEYCRGANHSKCCTFQYPLQNIDSVTDVNADVEKSATTDRKYWQTEKRHAPALISTEFHTPANMKRSGLTSNGLERWRYFENLVKRPDKQTDRSCPYCRSSEDTARLKNATYCRGRIESKDCTFDGHKGSLRISAKSKRPQEVVTPSQPPPPPPAPITAKTSTPKTPKTPTHPASGPDLTIDEAQLDIKLYYTSLIRDQQQIGYRFCPDCARSGDEARQQLSYWCRGRISYKACGHWDGDETRHRQRRRQSTDSKPNIKSAVKVVPSESVKPGISEGTVDSVSVLAIRTEVVGLVGATPARKRGRPRKSDDLAPGNFAAEISSLDAQTTPVPRIVPDTIPQTDQRSQTESIKRNPGRPRKSSLPGSQPLSIPASEPKVPVLDRPGNLGSSVPPAVADVDHLKSKRGRPRRSAPGASMKGQGYDGLNRKPNKPVMLSGIVNITSDVGRGGTHESGAIEPSQTTANVWPGWKARESPNPSRSEPHLGPRRKRSRTFDIVVPASRSSTPVAASPSRDSVGGQDRYFPGSVVPTSAMRNTHISHESPPHRLEVDIGIRELDSLPPSSPPTSLSLSLSPRPIRFMPSGHRSSPLASLRQHDRSSSAFSETGRGSMVIRGILRQSSEISDAPRKRARVSFSLPRSPSPVDESDDLGYDSDSSDDVLLLSEGPPSSRRSAPPSSSPLGPEARYAESPQAGRLSSSTLAAYARPLERTSLSHLGHFSSFSLTPPQAGHQHTARRSPLSSPPITSRSVPPSSNRGLMLPPPIPEYRLAPIPKSEPRPREHMPASSPGAASRPRSYSIPSKYHKQPTKKLVAENMVIRRLIDDVR